MLFRSVAQLALENFKKLKLSNILIVVGNIDKTLSEVFSKSGKFDFIFIDANHRMPATIEYFELCLENIHDDSIIVVDDLYWSGDMQKAWELIKNNPRVTTTIDLFHLGIVFFTPLLNKNHFKMLL